MFGKIINLPFRVIGKAARAVQERNDKAMKATHGEGQEGDDWSHLENIPNWDTPADFDPGRFSITAAQLRKEIASGRALTIVDVRTTKEFAEGSMDGAENLPAATLPIRLAELPPDEKVVTICNDGKDSRESARFLRFRGIEDSWHLQGGLAAWERPRKK